MHAIAVNEYGANPALVELPEAAARAESDPDQSPDRG